MSVPIAVCQFPVRQATWLVVDPADDAAPLQGQQRAVHLFGNHRPASLPAAVFGDGDACSAGSSTLSPGEDVNKLGAQLLSAHCLIASAARQ